MRGINKVILLGNVGRVPELRHLPDGRPIASFSLATSRGVLGKEGERQEETEWHKVVTFGKVAELCGQYLEKGRTLYVEGRLQTRQWTDKEGASRTSAEIVADTIQFLSRPGNRRGDARPAAPIVSEELGDIPF